MTLKPSSVRAIHPTRTKRSLLVVHFIEEGGRQRGRVHAYHTRDLEGEIAAALTIASQVHRCLFSLGSRLARAPSLS